VQRSCTPKKCKAAISKKEIKSPFTQAKFLGGRIRFSLYKTLRGEIRGLFDLHPIRGCCCQPKVNVKAKVPFLEMLLTWRKQKAARIRPRLYLLFTIKLMLIIGCAVGSIFLQDLPKNKNFFKNFSISKCCDILKTTENIKQTLYKA
jgi:hypothetical protein